MADKINDGGPAFPRSSGGGAYGTAQSGMSLRDWFAGQALIGLLASPGVTPTGATVRWAYEHADAMLAARQKQEA